MVNERQRLIRASLDTPRAAGVAGIIFSVLLFASQGLLWSVGRISPEDISQDRLKAAAGAAQFAITLVPFAGIAFLWFTGVIRDQIGEYEDRLFSTVFYGSAILFIAMMFLWAATLSALVLISKELALVDKDVLAYGISLTNRVADDYSIRMAGVYMLSVGTIWTRTHVVRRWLIWATYVTALGFILFANTMNGIRMAFPVWVFLVSIYTLYVNYHAQNHQTSTPEDRSQDA
jgi:hypothetical protein